MERDHSDLPGQSRLQGKLYEIIFEADTPRGKAFDIVLIVLIILSVLAVMLETVEELDRDYHQVFFYLEWALTILFTIEYFTRIYAVLKPWRYITSFFGIVDLMAILPTYISLFVSGSQYLLTIRVLRLLRVFRVFKIARYLSESEVILDALKASRAKITIFLAGVLTIVVVVGSVMFFIEGGENSNFTSIPRSMYWAIVTLTTVGYGDITPTTDLGQFLSAILMIMGYGIIAVPTGIVTSELAFAKGRAELKVNTWACPHCSQEGHDSDAEYCKHCGGKI